jgi:WS/DGAT/MGAT family acyltransferase
MRTLSGLDGSFLSLETPETPMHVGSLHLFEVQPGAEARFADDLRESVRQRLPRVPVFRTRLAPMPLQFANPVWVDDDTVDLDHHIQRVRLPEPGTREQLFRACADLHAQVMDRNRPLWMIYVFDGMGSGEVGYYIKVHHAVLDGLAGIELAETLFDHEPMPLPKGRRRSAAAPAAGRLERPGAAALAAAAFRHDGAQLVKLVRSLPEVARTVGGLLRASGAKAQSAASAAQARQLLAPRTSLNVSIGTGREFAGLSIPLAEVKRIAAANEAKVNDVVLAICSGALRRYLAQHGGIPRKSLVAAMPVSLRAPGNTEYTTQVTMALVSLASTIADPARRLRAIRDAAGQVKSTIGRARSIIPTDFPTIGVPWVMHALATLYGRSHVADVMPAIANVTVSNVPGPREPLYAPGARMTSYWPVSIVEHGVGLNITLISYAGSLCFGMIAARNAMPDIGRFAEAVQASHDELLALAEPARQKAPVGTAAVKRRAAGPRAASKAGRGHTAGARKGVKYPKNTTGKNGAGAARGRRGV